jgi:hypothetical protein
VLRQEPERLSKQPESAPHINSSLPELPVEDIAKLVQQGLRRNDDVLAESRAGTRPLTQPLREFVPVHVLV